MSVTKRHWKLQDVVAHSSNVNCLALGRQSGRVMVTGGDDKKVNLWTVGQPNCIMSLTGHTTAVECVQFDPRENMVCAGSMAGAVKAWDLESVRIIRTLTGHKANVKCLDFHPYGDFVVSGSVDTNIKLWDVRMKGCIYTYKGHSKTVNALRFSPDGKWVASGGDDGTVRLWDLSAGKMLTEFTNHTGPVTSVEFHPNEFLLASGSTDRTVKFWDLESFQLVSSSGGDGPAIRCLCFHRNGTCLFGASYESMKVYGWEPSCTFDSVPTAWGKVAHMALAQNQLIAGSYSMNTVNVYVVQLSTLNPLRQMVNDGETFIPGSELKSSSHIRRSFNTETSSHKLCDIDLKIDEKCLNPEDDIENDNLDVAVVDPDTIFSPRSELCRTPPKNDPFPAPLDGVEYLSKSCSFVKSHSSNSKPIPIEKLPFPPMEVPEKLVPNSKTGSPVRNAMSPMKMSYSTSSVTMSSKNTNQTFIVTSPMVSVSPSAYSRISEDSYQPSLPAAKPMAMRRQTPYPPEAVSIVRPTLFVPEKEVVPQRAVVMPEQLKSRIASSDFVPQQRDKPAGLSVDDFLPKSLHNSLSICETYQSEMSEAEAMNVICRENHSILSLLNNRNQKLKIVFALLKSKDLKLAIDTAIQMKDLAIIVDILGILNRHPALWTLDICQSLLSCLQELIQSKFETYMSVGCDALRLILKRFGTVIKNNVEAPPSIGVDLSGEERASKCKSCYDNLLGIRSFILKRQTMQGELGQSFRELLKIMCSEFSTL